MRALQPRVSRETLRRDALGQAQNAAGTDRVIDALVQGAHGATGPYSL